MKGNHLQIFEQLEVRLLEAADQLQDNSKLTSSEYRNPVLGIIFARDTTCRYGADLRQKRGGSDRREDAEAESHAADLLKRRA
jgi:hypothetical protein